MDNRNHSGHKATHKNESTISHQTNNINKISFPMYNLMQILIFDIKKLKSMLYFTSRQIMALISPHFAHTGGIVIFGS
jgi:hypothetical protein